MGAPRRTRAGRPAERRKSFRGHENRECSPYCQKYDFADRQGYVAEHRLLPDERKRLHGKSRREYAVNPIPLSTDPFVTHARVDAIDGSPIVLCEGPKAAHHVRKAGLGAASWLGGTGNVRHVSFDRLTGLDVVLWPDASDAGRKAMATAGREVARAAASVRMVDVTGLADDADAADVGGPDVICSMVSDAAEWEAPPLPDLAEDLTPARAQANGLLPSHYASLITGYRGRPETPEAAAAAYAAAYLKAKFRFDGANWYVWERSAWRLGVGPDDAIRALVHDRWRAAADAANAREDEELLRILASPSRAWAATTRSPTGDFQAALALHLRRPTPRLGHDYLATPTSLVHWPTGETWPLDPREHDVTATSRGEYRPDDWHELIEHLQTRLSHAFTPDDYLAFTTMLGLAVTRWSNDPSIIWLVGTSGSGKSWLANLVAKAFGDLAHQVTESTLNQRQEIGANLADLIVSDPIFGIAVEVNSIRDARLNALTGRDRLSARHPHGRMVHGEFTGRLLATSVTAPRARSHEGLARRVEAFGFTKPVDDGLKTDAELKPLDLDAIVTVAITKAKLLHRRREAGDAWERPRGNATRRFLAAADDVAGWLSDLGDEYHGKPLGDVRAAYEAATGEALSARSLGRHLASDPRWVSARESGGSRTRWLALRENALASKASV